METVTESEQTGSGRFVCLRLSGAIEFFNSPLSPTFRSSSQSGSRF